MKRAQGPRPWSIRLFALCFLLAASWRLVDHLTHPLMAQMAYLDRFPRWSWTPDWVIVASFAEFTIALIPIVWIYLLASRFARWFVVILGVIGLAPHSADPGVILASVQLPPSLIVPPLAIVIALAALFTPSAARWLAGAKEAGPAPRA